MQLVVVVVVVVRNFGRLLPRNLIELMLCCIYYIYYTGTKAAAYNREKSDYIYIVKAVARDDDDDSCKTFSISSLAARCEISPRALFGLLTLVIIPLKLYIPIYVVVIYIHERVFFSFVFRAVSHGYPCTIIYAHFNSRLIVIPFFLYMTHDAHNEDRN